MDNPFATRPIAPGLRPHRVERANRDRRGKGRSFEDEMAEDHQEEGTAGKPARGLKPGHPPPPPEAKPAPPAGEGGHLLDLEA